MEEPIRELCCHYLVTCVIIIIINLTCIALFLKNSIALNSRKDNLKCKTYNKNERVRTELIKFRKKSNNCKFES